MVPVILLVVFLITCVVALVVLYSKSSKDSSIPSPSSNPSPSFNPSPSSNLNPDSSDSSSLSSSPDSSDSDSDGDGDGDEDSVNTGYRLSNIHIDSGSGLSNIVNPQDWKPAFPDTLTIGSLNVLEYLGLKKQGNKMSVDEFSEETTRTSILEKVDSIYKVDLLFTQEEPKWGNEPKDERKEPEIHDWYRVRTDPYKGWHRGYRTDLAYGLYASKPLEELGIYSVTGEIIDTVQKECNTPRSYALYTFQMASGSTFKVANYHACGGAFDDKKLAQEFKNLPSSPFPQNGVKDHEAKALADSQADIILGDMNAPLEATDFHKRHLTTDMKKYADTHVFYLVRALQRNGYRLADNPVNKSATSMHGSRVDYIMYRIQGQQVMLSDVKITNTFIDNLLTDHEMVYATVTVPAAPLARSGH